MSKMPRQSCSLQVRNCNMKEGVEARFPLIYSENFVISKDAFDQLLVSCTTEIPPLDVVINIFG